VSKGDQAESSHVGPGRGDEGQNEDESPNVNQIWGREKVGKTQNAGEDDDQNGNGAQKAPPILQPEYPKGLGDESK
jgi:hypothetical protein